MKGWIGEEGEEGKGRKNPPNKKIGYGAGWRERGRNGMDRRGRGRREGREEPSKQKDWLRRWMERKAKEGGEGGAPPFLHPFHLQCLSQ